MSDMYYHLSTNALVLDGLQDEITEAYINDADSVVFQIFASDKTTQIDTDVSANYIANSNGKYVGYVNLADEVDEYDEIYVLVTVTVGSDTLTLRKRLVVLIPEDTE